jgi:hypothetical protein
MDVAKINFNEYLGINRSKDSNYTFEIKKNDNYLNHLKTIHASVLFALSEATSGECLLESFPEYKDKYVPILRKAEVKYSKPADNIIRSKSIISNEEKSRVITEIDKRKRALVNIKVELVNEMDEIIMKSNFEWFIMEIRN